MPAQPHAILLHPCDEFFVMALVNAGTAALRKTLPFLQYVNQQPSLPKSK